ncbi:MAG: sulfatase-like hydrolase/transferase [Phycisphaerae bacterium]|nr:sulfatase-like hydrolase/transferase [Phycisphaerae bacterium]
MKRLIAIFPCVFAMLASTVVMAEQPQNDPGDGRVKTPRIDALADRGVHFTDAHSTCAICIPSRYSILSGTYYFHAKFKGR